MTSPAPQPQGSPDAGASPDQGGASAAPQQGGQQANQLQVAIGKIAQIVQALGGQNQIIQPECQEVLNSCRKMFLKVTQASQPQAQPPSPQGQ